MKKEELKELMEDSLEKAKNLLLRDGKLVPVAFIYHGNNVDIICLTFKNAFEKDIHIRMLKKMIKKKNADAIFMITESWHVASKEKNLNIIPSKHPLREECIFLVGECEHGRIAMMLPFGRKNKEIVFGKKFDMNGMAFTRFDFGLKDKKHKPTNSSLN